LSRARLGRALRLERPRENAPEKKQGDRGKGLRWDTGGEGGGVLGGGRRRLSRARLGRALRQNGVTETRLRGETGGHGEGVQVGYWGGGRRSSRRWAEEIESSSAWPRAKARTASRGAPGHRGKETKKGVRLAEIPLPPPTLLSATWTSMPCAVKASVRWPAPAWKRAAPACPAPPPPSGQPRHTPHPTSPYQRPDRSSNLRQHPLRP
jgi:hypothetical protein